jgi:hypothetical protein
MIIPNNMISSSLLSGTGGKIETPDVKKKHQHMKSSGSVYSNEDFSIHLNLISYSKNGGGTFLWCVGTDELSYTV